MSIQNGKKPLSSKARPTPQNMDDLFGNTLGLDPKITEALDKQGKAYRFISAKKLGEMGGYHEMGWSPIKMKDIGGTMDVQSFTLGADPEGYLRRGDLVLAVRPKELNEKHKAHLKERANLSKNLQKKHAEEIRGIFRKAGVNEQVSEGYDDETTE